MRVSEKVQIACGMRMIEGGVKRYDSNARRSWLSGKSKSSSSDVLMSGLQELQ